MELSPSASIIAETSSAATDKCYPSITDFKNPNKITPATQKTKTSLPQRSASVGQKIKADQGTKWLAHQEYEISYNSSNSEENL